MEPLIADRIVVSESHARERKGKITGNFSVRSVKMWRLSDLAEFRNANVDVEFSCALLALIVSAARWQTF
jgi:hypothetical protein